MNDFPELHHEAAGTDLPPLLFLHGGNAASWSWEEQVPAFSDRLVLTLDLPGFGRCVDDDWPGLDGAADAIAARVVALGVDGPLDVVGLSGGGLAALHLAARHPGLVNTLLVTGPMLAPTSSALRAGAALQLAVWDQRWYWRAQSVVMGLPPVGRDLFVEHGLTIHRETMRRIVAEVYSTGGLPSGIAHYTGPLLALAGERESAYFRRSLRVLAREAPQTTVRLAPGMHHVWSVEDADLFNDVVRAWVDGAVEPRLLALDRA